MASTTDAVRPDPYMRAHVDDALIENARFLLERGLHIELVAKRLGVSVSHLEQTMRRFGG